MNLRPYQQDIVDRTLAAFEHFRRVLVVVPTGGGKTVIFSKLAEAMQPGRTLILAHREELIDQAIDKLYRATGIVAGKEKAEWTASRTAPVVVASVQSMLNRLDRWEPDHFTLVVADEAHHAISPSWLKVLEHFAFSNVLGVTATPDRGDKRNLGQFFETVAAEVTLRDLIAQQFLVPIKVQAIPLEIDLSEVSSKAGDFDEGELGSALEPYLETIAGHIATVAQGRKVLAFLPLRDTSKKFVEACEAAGLRAKHVDGVSADRRQILEDYSAGQFDVLSNAMLLTEGYDEPSVDCVLILRPTRSRPLYCQMVGRGTRPSPGTGKQDLLLLDFLWMHERHNLIRPAHLIAKSAETAEAMTRRAEEAAKAGRQESLDLEGLENETTAEREKALREELARQAKKQAKTLDAVEFCLACHDSELADWQPSFKWEEAPVSPKQAEALARAGIDPESVKGKGHASAILDKIFQRRAQGLATPKQIRFLKRYNHPRAEEATFEEASAFLDKVWGKKKAA